MCVCLLGRCVGVSGEVLCVCVCVCVWACAWEGKQVHSCAQTHVEVTLSEGGGMHAQMQTHTHIHAHACMHAHTCTHTCTRTGLPSDNHWQRTFVLLKGAYLALLNMHVHACVLLITHICMCVLACSCLHAHASWYTCMHMCADHNFQLEPFFCPFHHVQSFVLMQ